MTRRLLTISAALTLLALLLLFGVAGSADRQPLTLPHVLALLLALALAGAAQLCRIVAETDPTVEVSA